MNVDLSKIPQDWFLYSLHDKRTNIVFKGETHNHLHWVCELQHITGGKLCGGVGRSANEALDDAIARIKRVWSQQSL